LSSERTLALPSFSLTDANARAVADICSRLDGIPLLLELAARSVRLLGVEELATRLDDSLGLLTAGSRTAAPRHRTLLATLQ
jgi:predicted ATPase